MYTQKRKITNISDKGSNQELKLDRWVSARCLITELSLCSLPLLNLLVPCVWVLGIGLNTLLIIKLNKKKERKTEKGKKQWASIGPDPAWIWVGLAGLYIILDWTVRFIIRVGHIRPNVGSPIDSCWTHLDFI